MDEAEFRRFLKGVSEDLNKHVFPRIQAHLLANPQLRRHLNPAFPFPKTVRVGVLSTHLAVEYVGPEDPTSNDFATEGIWRPDATLLDFLGLDVTHLSCPRLPCPFTVENMQVFLGDAMNILGDYLFDIVSNPNDVVLNGLPDFSGAKDYTYISNVSLLWSDAQGALRVRRIDFMELFPVQNEGWFFHTEESFTRFADFLAEFEIPQYQPSLHAVLNDFIQLVASRTASEPDLTTFLADHQEILQLALGAHALNPQIDLQWQDKTGKPDLKPDFMPVRMDGYADILEFKLPTLKGRPLVGTDTRVHPSFEIDAALAQIDEYSEWCGQDVNRRWLLDTKGIKVHAPHTYLVIGHRDEFTAQDRQKLRSRRNATIFTYDEFIEMARMQLYRVR